VKTTTAMFSSSTALRENKFRNPELEARTNEIEAEFNRILKSGVSGSSPERKSLRDSPEKDNFYALMNEMKDSSQPKHKSPTKRLIQQK